MKDLIFVTAFCPTEEQIERLRRCINLLSAAKGFDLALISHTHVPIDIQKNCKYYIYDHLNELDDDDKLLHFEYYSDENFYLKSKFFRKTPFYGFSIYRMFSQISGLAISLGYQRIYHVEYDYLIYDLNIFEHHKLLLQEYNSVFYFNSAENKLLVGGLKSFVVGKLPELFRIYDKQRMKNKILSENLIPLEQFTKRIFLEAGNCVFLYWNTVESKISKTQFESQELNWSLFYNVEDDTIGIIYFNKYNKKTQIKQHISIRSNLKNFEFELEQGTHTIRTFGPSDELLWIKVFRNKTLVFEYDINVELLNRLKINAPLQSRKGN